MFAANDWLLSTCCSEMLTGTGASPLAADPAWSAPTTGTRLPSTTDHCNTDGGDVSPGVALLLLLSVAAPLPVL